MKHEHLFIDVDFALEILCEDEEEELEESVVLQVEELLSIFNFMIFVHQVLNGAELLSCCNNFFKEVIRSKKLPEEIITFSVALREFSLKVARDLKIHDSKKLVDVYFPKKYYFPERIPEGAEKVKELTLKRREEVKMQIAIYVAVLNILSFS